MPTETTYTNLRANLAGVLDNVADNREVVVVRRRGAKDVAIIAADELSSVLETAHLLRSPKNAQRLMASLRRARKGELKPLTIEQLRREVGLARAD